MLKKILALVFAALLLPIPSLADDLSNGSWSTTDNSNNAAPPNGWPAGMFPNQVEPSARSNMGGIKRWWERANAGLSTTGSGGAYVITPSNTSYPTAYTQGEVMCGKANFTAVGNDTLNYNSLGAKPIYTVYQGIITRILANGIHSGQQFCVSYDSVLNSGGGGFQLLNAAGSGFPTGTISALANSTSAQVPLPASTGGFIILNGGCAIGNETVIAGYSTLGGFTGAVVMSNPVGSGSSCSTAVSSSGTGFVITMSPGVGAGNYTYTIIPATF